MLFGEYEHQVDAKFRIRIPSRFKNFIGNDYVFMRGSNKCISVYPAKVFEARYGQFANVSVFDAEGQKALAEVFSYCFPACEDGQGRVVIPEKLRNYAGIDKDVVSIGLGDHIDMYSKDERENIRSSQSYSDIVSVLQGKIG
jgi:MraZ protein